MLDVPVDQTDLASKLNNLFRLCNTVSCWTGNISETQMGETYSTCVFNYLPKTCGTVRPTTLV